jgi:hypothetical protein
LNPPVRRPLGRRIAFSRNRDGVETVAMAALAGSRLWLGRAERDLKAILDRKQV